MRCRPERNTLMERESSSAAEAEHRAGGPLPPQFLWPGPCRAKCCSPMWYLQPVSLGARLPAGPCTVAAPGGIFSLLEAEMSLISPTSSMMHVLSCKHKSEWFCKPGLWLPERAGSGSPSAFMPRDRASRVLTPCLFPPQHDGVFSGWTQRELVCDPHCPGTSAATSH